MNEKPKRHCLMMVMAALPYCVGQAALAGPLEEAKARAHLDAVAAGNLDVLMQDYADGAFMEWVGGPLDGRYRGKEAIRCVWQKFIAINAIDAGNPRPASFGKLVALSNP